jgi:hypothetical protein
MGSYKGASFEHVSDFKRRGRRGSRGRRGRQGDRMVRTFAYWVTVYYFGQLFANDRNSPDYWAIHFRGKSCVLILTKKRFGLHFG